MSISRRRFLGASALAIAASSQFARAEELSAQLGAAVELPIVWGESKTIIEANPDEPGEKGWYTNDHCFIEDRQGRLHWIGINNPFPPKGKRLYRCHPYLGHLSATDPWGPWERHDWALDESKGTEYLGAPYVIWSPEQERYVMVVETRLDNTRRLEVCYSNDLHTWQRTHQPILADTLWVATRDPQILRRPNGDYWVIVTSFGAGGVKQSQIIRLVTKDFQSFVGPEVILGINDCKWATLIESPFLVERNGVWYLMFTYAHRRYTETSVVVSNDPAHFDFEKGCVTTLFSHAAEVFSYKGKSYISSCGPEDKSVLNTHGVTLAELRWARLS